VIAIWREGVPVAGAFPTVEHATVWVDFEVRIQEAEKRPGASPSAPLKGRLPKPR
jgi:hypothetical protein